MVGRVTPPSNFCKIEGDTGETGEGKPELKRNEELRQDAVVVKPNSSELVFRGIMVRTGFANDKKEHLSDLAKAAGLIANQILLVDDDKYNITQATKDGYFGVFSSGFCGWGSRTLATYNAFELLNLQRVYTDLIDLSRPISPYRSYASAVLTRQIPNSLYIRPHNLNSLLEWKKMNNVDASPYRNYMDKELNLRSAAVEKKFHISIGSLTDRDTNFGLISSLVLGWNQYQKARPSTNDYQTFSPFWLAFAMFVDISFLDMCGAVNNQYERSDSILEQNGDFCIIRSSQVPKGAKPQDNMFVVKLLALEGKEKTEERLLVVPGVGILPYPDENNRADSIVRGLTQDSKDLYPTLGAYLMTTGYGRLLTNRDSRFAIQTNPMFNDLPSDPDTFFEYEVKKYFDSAYDEAQVAAEEEKEDGDEDENPKEGFLGQDGRVGLFGDESSPHTSSRYRRRRPAASEEKRISPASGSQWYLDDSLQEEKVQAGDESSPHTANRTSSRYRRRRPAASEEKRFPASGSQWYLDDSLQEEKVQAGDESSPHTANHTSSRYRRRRPAYTH